MTKGTKYTRILLLTMGIMAALTLSLTARSNWTYSSINEASSNTLSLVGMFNIYSSGSAAGLEVVINNPTDSLLTILWDESVMVLPGGVSERVIHTGVRIIDKAAPQAPTAIAPRSRTTEAIWPASYVTTSEYVPIRSISLSNNSTLSLYLTVQDASGKRTENWTWSFTETVIPQAPRAPRKPVNWLKVWLWVGVFACLGLIGSMLPEE